MHDKNINSTAFFFIFIIQQTFALEFTLQVDIDGAIQFESFLLNLKQKLTKLFLISNLAASKLV